MTYDLYVLRIEAGKTWQEALADHARSGDEPEWPPAELSGAELDAWQRIVSRVRSEIGPVTTECEPHRAELTLDGPDVALNYSCERVEVRIPHGYEGVTALRALYHGYAIARIAADETGAVAVDPTTGRRLPSSAEEPQQVPLAS